MLWPRPSDSRAGGGHTQLLIVLAGTTGRPHNRSFLLQPPNAMAAAQATNLSVQPRNPAGWRPSFTDGNRARRQTHWVARTPSAAAAVSSAGSERRPTERQRRQHSPTAAQAAASDTEADYESDVDGQTMEQRLSMVVNMVGRIWPPERRQLLPTASLLAGYRMWGVASKAQGARFPGRQLYLTFWQQSCQSLRRRGLRRCVQAQSRCQAGVPRALLAGRPRRWQPRSCWSPTTAQPSTLG